MTTDIRNLNEDEINSISNELNIPKFRINQIKEWIWGKNIIDFDKMSNIPSSLIDELKKRYHFNFLTLEKKVESSDKTIKVVFKQNIDNTLVEGVIIPSSDRVTACISSQTGCSLSCTFCATGNIKTFNNLSAGEIYDQVYILNQLSFEKFNRKLTNIVLMGMGEPLLNYNNVIMAIKQIINPKGLGFSPSRITLSTVGISKNIYKLADENLNINLAISLHTANNSKRDILVPYNIKDPLENLSEAIVYFKNKTNIRITIEYLLLKNINDGINDAKELAIFCKSFPCKINLIEYNSTNNNIYSKSSPENTKNFKDFLDSKNMIVNIRRSRGQDIDAACGQLVNKELSKKNII